MYSAGQIPTAGEFGTSPATYTPVLTATTTNPDLGTDATITGWWQRLLENLIHYEFRIVFGTGSSAGSGLYSVSLPTPADGTLMNATTNVGFFSPIGGGSIRDASASPGPGSMAITAGLVTVDSGTNGNAQVRLFHMDGTNSTVQDSAPWTWADGDAIVCSGAYLIG